MELKRVLPSILVAIVAIGMLPVGAALGATAQRSANQSLTVEVNSLQWTTLDPATNAQDAADVQLMNAIYGGLFEEGPKDAVTPSIATGYKYSDHNTALTISLRHGVKFQDGTALTASVVAWNINRDLAPSHGCLCDANFVDVTSVTAKGGYSVVIDLKTADAALVSAFIGEAPNWIASENAVNQGAVAFGQAPVGAGPFKVVHNVDSSELQLTRYAGYFEKGKPMLANLTFQSVGSDQSAYDAIESTEAQALLSATTTPVVQLAGANRSVTLQSAASTTPYFLYFDLKSAQGGNINVRRAIAYAVDARLLDSAIYAGKSPLIQGVETPGQLFYEKNVKGYLAYNAGKARRIVATLPNKNITFITATNQTVWVEEGQAIETMLIDVGFNVTERVDSIQQSIEDYANHNFDVSLAIWAGFDPATFLPVYFSPQGLFSQIDDATLTGMEQRAAALANLAERAKLYAQIYSYIDTHVYAAPLYAYPTWNVFDKTVHGITAYPVDWAEVYLT